MAEETQRLIFISYSSNNRGFALELAKELKASGFRVWFDQLDIPKGSRWDDEIEKALSQCEIFLVILTQKSIESHNVKDEIGYAIDSNKRILPILLEKVNIPFRLRRFQYVDFTTKSNNEGIDLAKQLLRTLMDEAEEAETEPSVHPVPSRQPEVDRSEELHADAQRLARQRAEAIRNAREKEQRERSAQVTPPAPAMQKRAPQPQKQQSTKLFSIIGVVALISILCIGGGYYVVTNLPLPSVAPTTAVPTTVTPSFTPTTPESPPGITPTTPAPPEKRELVFVSDRGQAVGNFQAFVIDPDNPNPTSYQPFSVNPTNYERVYWPSFCGDQIAVEASDTSENGMVQWIYLLDRSSPPSPWELASDDELGQPRCSPDGKYLSYSVSNQGKWDTLVVADTSNKSLVYSSNYLEGKIVGRVSWTLSMEMMFFPILTDRDNLIWSIYFVRNFSPNWSDSNYRGESPAISPDGRQLAYYCKDSAPDIGPLCVTDISSGATEIIAKTDRSHRNDFNFFVSTITPAWSSDGQWIYYLDYDGGDYDIFRIHPDGSGRENVTRDWPSNELMPATR